jgi:hypothetical protein
VHVIAVHDISDPEGFMAAVEPVATSIPDGMKLHSFLPSKDGSQAVCVWEAGAVEDVRSFIDGATVDLATNEYFPVADAQAIGLPA